MRAPLAQRATGIERTFGNDEIIVTKTDTRGLLTYTNEVFLRVSALDEVDAIGKPHNIIRHPDMPRAIFALLWETVKNGDELFAYVVNMAADGAHYWVLAHVTPSWSGNSIVGYHSNRRVPSRQAVTKISEIYGRLRAIELAASSAQQGLADSQRAMAEILEERGETYEQFVWRLTTESENN